MLCHRPNGFNNKKVCFNGKMFGISGSYTGVDMASPLQFSVDKQSDKL